ncbi:MAG: hypothetical protein IT262_20420 [Saprospiraceae bacterium]|nr:hypothetical protein [Saprospiraceae bacterium]
MLLILSNSILFAQTDGPTNAQVLVEKLLNAKVFVDYSKLKKDIETQLIALNSQPDIASADYLALQNAYNHTQTAFDGFIGVVRQDMLDFQLFEKAAAGDEPTLLRYLAAYNAGVETYNREFLPTYNRIVKTRVLPAWLVPLGIQAFNFLGTLFKGKNPRKDVVINDLLMVSNYLFLQKMQMKSWEELVTVQPAGGSPSGIPATMASATPYLATSTVSEQPVMKTLSGQLEFRIAGTTRQSMAFEPVNRATRDIVVEASAPIGGNSTTIDLPLLRSVQAYPEGAAFQIRLQNSALLYAFTLNSNGTCAPVYPFSESWVRGFNMGKTRDLSIGPLMLKDESGGVVIPSCDVQTGRENYIRITGNSEKEQLCLMVSMSEIDLNDVMGRISQLQGSLAERVAALWQADPHCATATEAQVRMEDAVIYYDVQNGGKWFLPLVFEIRR